MANIFTLEQLLELLPDAKKVSSNHLKTTCVFCGKKDKMYIHRGIRINKKGIVILHGWDCKAADCGKSGTIYSLLKQLDKEYMLDGEIIEDTEIIVNRFREPTIDNLEEVVLSEPKIVKLPIGSKLLQFNNLQCLFRNYLCEVRKSKFTEIDFEVYQPYKTEIVPKFSEYVLFPIIQDFEIRGFFGRYIGEDPEMRRYENNKGAKFSELIYGFDEITNKTHTLILVEGGIDKISVSRKLDLHNQDEIKCIGTFGKKFSDTQMMLIKQRTKVRNLLFMYDTRDAVNEIKKSGLVAKKYFNVEACEIPFNKDPDLMSVYELLFSMNNSIPIEKFFYDKVQFGALK